MKIITTLLLLGLFALSCGQRNQQGYPAYSPIAIQRVMPEYPEILKRAGFEAVVELSALVNEAGNVREVKIIKSSPLVVVDSVSVLAAQEWKFKPGKLPNSSGEYQPGTFWVPIFFDWSTNREYIILAY